MAPPPERLSWAVERLAVEPNDRILEIGCGTGVAVALICERLDGGDMLGVDRSQKAITAAVARNAEHVASGRASFRAAPFESLVAYDVGSFDSVLAVNVNLFWVRNPTAELTLVKQVLRPAGRLLLVYEPPDASQLSTLQQRLVDNLSAVGFSATTATRPGGRAHLLAVTARADPSLTSER